MKWVNFSGAIAAGFAILMALARTQAANAEPRRFYYEIGGGLGQMYQGTSFFGANAKNPLGYGFALNSTFGIALGKPDRTFKISTGLQGRFVSGTGNGEAFTLFIPYWVFRFQVAGIFFGIGGSPVVFARGGTTSGFDFLARKSGAVAGMAEAGYFYSVTPAVGLISSIGTQWVSSGGTLGPAPTVEATVGLRFFFGVTNAGAVSDEQHFRGWRYPYGWDSNNK